MRRNVRVRREEGVEVAVEGLTRKARFVRVRWSLEGEVGCGSVV